MGIHGHSNTFSTTEQVLLGLNFSDLLVRLFLRVAKQSRLTELPYPEILAEQTPELGQRDNVLFFGGVLKNVHVRRQEPIDFAVELARRWEAACPTVALSSNARQRKDGVPKGSIFISYAKRERIGSSCAVRGVEGAGVRGLVRSGAAAARWVFARRSAGRGETRLRDFYIPDF